MSKANRIFPLWKKAKKGERMPGEHPHRPVRPRLRVPEPVITPITDKGPNEERTYAEEI